MDESQRESAFLALERAKDIAGDQSKLARICGCTPGNIWQLLQKRSPLPARFVLKVESETGVSRHELRPDVYPEEAPVPSVASLPFRGRVGSGDQRPKMQIGEPVR